MSVTLHASKIRLVSSLVLSIVGLLIILFLLPHISKNHPNNNMLQADAILTQKIRDKDLNEIRTEVGRIKLSQHLLDDFYKNIQIGDAQKLHWELSNKLFELSSKYGVRILNVKYASASRLVVVGDSLESLNVDFDINGIYMNLKSFMLALEKSNHGSIVVEARLEESAEGGHLAVRLFAFWRLMPIAANMMASTL